MNVGAARPGVNRHLKVWLSSPSDRVIDRQLPAARRLDRLASIRMKAKTQGAPLLLTQACIVPRCTQMSPAFIRTVLPSRRRVRGRIRP
jgi:hypothetical protein